MALIFFDARALVKRYSGESGVNLVNAAFAYQPRPRMHCAMIGVLEIIAILTRRRNDGRLPTLLFQKAMIEFEAEVLHDETFIVASLTDALALSAINYIPHHNLNATDAMVLRAAVELRASLTAGDPMSFWSSDKRLLRAAAAEGLPTFDPEQDTIERLHELLSA